MSEARGGRDATNEPGQTDRDSGGDSDSGILAKAIISLGHSLRLKVVAEGADTGAQVDFLRAQHCDEVQGYFFGRPMPAEELAEVLSQQRVT